MDYTRTVVSLLLRRTPQSSSHQSHQQNTSENTAEQNAEDGRGPEEQIADVQMGFRNFPESCIQYAQETKYSILES